MKKMFIFCLLCVFFLTSCNTKEPGAESQPQSNENITSCPFIPRDVYSPQNYNGLDIELTFWIKDSEEPCGIWGPLVDFFEESPKIDVVSAISEFPVGETIEGTLETKTWDGFAIHSFVPTEDTARNGYDRTVYSIVSTRDDIFTYRGIHVGSSLEDVFSAYPDLAGLGYDLETWKNDPNTENKVRYTPEEYWGSLAPWLTFHIENDTVVKIEMEYLRKGKTHDLVNIRGERKDDHYLK